MEFITRIDPATEERINISVKSYGAGKPIVLIHGWPLSKEMWEYQLEPLIGAGLNVVKYDRRGFGKSSKPWTGYDYDTLTDDLHVVLETLDLRDVTLVGFSMGGGEAVRYLSRYGNERVSKLVLISAVTPFMAQTNDNPEGVPQSTFTDMLNGLRDDRIGFLADFGKKFFGVSLLKKPVSEPLLQYYLGLQSKASGRATRECVQSFAYTDFRKDCAAVTVPTLVIHGDADEIVPKETGGDQTVKLIPHAQYLVYEGQPHGLFYTHKDQLSLDLSNFALGKLDIGPAGTL